MAKPKKTKALVFAKSDSTEVRVELSEFKGRPLLNMREWYEKDGDMNPGKGFTIPAAKGFDFLSELRDWIDDNLETFEELALDDEAPKRKRRRDDDEEDEEVKPRKKVNNRLKDVDRVVKGNAKKAEKNTKAKPEKKKAKLNYL